MRCSGLCSLGRRGLNQPLCWRARNLKAQFYPLFDQLVYALAATVVAGDTYEGASLVSVRSAGVGSVSHFVGGHDR